MNTTHRWLGAHLGLVYLFLYGPILVLIVLRLAWRLTHPVAPESSLPAWQRLTSELVHWMLYVMVLATTLSGWLFASFRGWSLSFFHVFPLPMLASDNAAAGKAIDGLHQAAEWSLLVLIVLHTAAALVHLFFWRDGVMRRMLPAPSTTSVGKAVPLRIGRTIDASGINGTTGRGSGR